MSAQPVPDSAAADSRRWRALWFICLAQLMVVVDGTIVNIALPSAQHDLGFSDTTRQWVVTGYALAFGGLLLLGGRIADVWGRKRAFLVGVIGFAAASALGGAATSTGMLLGARALQGAFGALLSPSALSLITLTFRQPKDRAKAFGIYSVVAGGGAAVGLVLGGFLTEYANWRWTLYVNVGLAVVAATGAVLVIREPVGPRSGPTRFDLPGVLLSSAGLATLVYGCANAESDGWGSVTTVGRFVASVVLLALFVLVESRSRNPLLPLRVLRDRNRGGAYLSLAVAVTGMFGLLLFLTFYLQVVLGYSPVVAGLAFLPMVAGMMLGSTQIGTRLVTKVPPRLLMGPGFLIGAAGLAWMTRMSVTDDYASVVLPGMLLLGLGVGSAFTPAMNLATSGVGPTEAGVASAMVNTSQQIGGAIGTALLNTIATSATAAWATSHLHRGMTPAELGTAKLQALVHGYNVAMWCSAGFLVAAAAIALVLIDHRPVDRRAHPTDDAKKLSAAAH
ncbi:MFS transporter [Kitasatospora viridis]|uniref:EmrB/QacA subfamily drug resistance transporter n=1 Tax=Kitasatospora viridis TaxID=281105 RepID=A0A561TSU3_9ACTN|nr:MFS transporter [Kitasatospora viridis]TWF90160.1 EmrB/QacA subfamily drug resistance transporter [Kitasatospora viridis]